MKYVTVLMLFFYAIMMNAQSTISTDQIVDSERTAELLFNSGKYELCISAYQRLILLNPVNKQKYLARMGEISLVAADTAYKNNDYEKALGFYRQSISCETSLQSGIFSKMARIHFDIANSALGNHNYEIAALNYKLAVVYDPGTDTDVSTIFNSIQKDPVYYTALSIIPGLGQIAHEKKTKGVVMFSTFVLFWAEGSHLRHEYPLVMDEHFNTVNVISNISNLCYLATAAMIVYSMIDSYTDITAYNRMFTVHPAEPNVQINLRSGQTLISLNLAL